MKPVTAFLVVLAFLLPGPAFHEKAGRPLQAPPPGSESYAPGSAVRFVHLTIQDGLSQNAGLVLFQDSRGFLWIGTQDGLNRYDGYSFTVFKHDAENPASISHNSILSIAEDHDGYLWVGTWGGGLNRFDPTTETFLHYHHEPGVASSLSNDTVTDLKQDSSGTLWVGTLGGLDRFDPQTGSFAHYRNSTINPVSLSSNAISFIFEDSQRQLWIGTGALGVPGAGLNRFDPDSGKAIRYRHDPLDPTSLGSDNISCMYEDTDGSLWIGTGGFSLAGNGLDRFNPHTGRAVHFTHKEQGLTTLSGDNISSLWGEPGGALWIGTWDSGLNSMYFARPGLFMRYQHNPYFPDSLSGDTIWSLFKDRSGVLWIGTGNSGINKLPPTSGQFGLYRNNPADPASLAGNTIGAFTEDRYGRIWVGTWNAGLDRLDTHSGQFTHFRHDPADASSLSNDLIMALYADSENAIWAGTLGGGLERVDASTGGITHFRQGDSETGGLPDDNVASLLPDRKGGLWLGTFGGLSHFDPASGSFVNYSADASRAGGLSENKVVSLYIDSHNDLWIGTWGGGLDRLDLDDPRSADPQRAVFEVFKHEESVSSSLSENSVWTMHETADGALWLGTQAALDRFDRSTREFRHYTEADGLPNSNVLGILEDMQGNLWLTTNNGLSKLDPRTQRFTNYDETDGLQSNEFNSNAYFKSRDGTMFVGGVNGFSTFRPSDIKPNTAVPQVVITRFEVFNEPMPVDLSGRKPVELSYQQNFISFEFAALDFHAPNKNQYAYMLEGFDKDWVMAGNRRFVSYTNLPGGKYVFHVKASNNEGVWNVIGTSIPVVVTPPVWKTWWFQGLGGLALILLVATGFYGRLSSVRRQQAILERQVAIRTSELQHQIEQRQKAEQALAEKAAQEAVTIERTRLARDLHDAVTQTLFSASLIAEVLPDLWSMSRTEGEKRIEELRLLTRGALAEMRTLLVELRPNALIEIPLADLLRQLCESLIGRARLPIQLHVQGSRKLPPDVQIGFYRITQEALNNVVKHAKATQAIVTLNLDETFSVSIIDNGCGFDPQSVPPDHLGLQIMHERAEGFGAQLSIYSQPGEGTQICVTWTKPGEPPAAGVGKDSSS